MSQGVYTNGGKLHVFDSSAYFGVFIIRKDGRIYVPAAFQKSSSGYVSFGDNWTQGYTSSAGQTNSAIKLPQMTVSPDGRFAAFKLRTSTSFNQYETANTTPILLFSLTGERIEAWDDEVYKIVDSGSSGSTSTGQYLFASSLTLTNGYLYYLVGSGSTSYLHFKDHYIYRYDLFGGDDEGSLLHSNFNSEWTNSSGNAMQTPYQCYGRHVRRVRRARHHDDRHARAQRVRVVHGAAPVPGEQRGQRLRDPGGRDHVEHLERLGGPLPPRVGGLRG